MAAKRVESFRVPCLDAGSTPATSTENRAFMRKSCNSANYGIFFLCPAGACGGMRKIFPSAKVAHSEPSGASVMKFAAELQHLTHHSGVPSSRTAATLPERSAR